jgi:predicted RNA-binding protein YlxR (DUF448 family)
MKPKIELLRVVVNKETSEVCLDKTGKMSGRGAYICKNEQCLQDAKKKKGLERALDIKISDDFYEEIKKEIN